MELRYRLAVVTGAGDGLGRQVAVALSRAGAAVLSVDGDAAAAEETAELVRAARVGSWSLQADLTEDVELQMAAARARDLGGADLLVVDASGWTAGDRPWPTRLVELFLEDAADRRGRRDGSPGAVTIAPCVDLVAPTSWDDPAVTSGARVMAVVPSSPGPERLAVPLPPATVTRAVLRLLRSGVAGQVVEVSP